MKSQIGKTIKKDHTLDAGAGAIGSNDRKLAGSTFLRRSIWTLCLLAPVLYFVGCKEAGSSYCVNANSSCGMQTIAVRNPRFDLNGATPTPSTSPTATPTPTPPVNTTGSFWLKSGEPIFAKWDEYTLFLTAPGATCDGISFDGAQCQRCNFVHWSPNECRGAFRSGDYLDVTKFDGFNSSSQGEAVALDIPGVQLRRQKIDLQQNSTVQISTDQITTVQKWATAMVHVIAGDTNGMGTPATYQAQSLSQPNDPDIVFFSVSPVPDHFSTNLRIGSVIVKKGFTDMKDGEFALKDGGTLLQPSRIVLMPGFTEGTRVADRDGVRCYARYPNGGPDPTGNIDLTRCFHDHLPPPGSQATPTPTPAPPVIINANPEFQSGQTANLTWVIEFKISDGGVLPVFEQGEVVAIEFAIFPV